MNPAPGPAKALYLADLRVGQRFTTDSYQMDEEPLKAFAGEFHPQSFHLDDAAARGSIFQGLAASGWHTAAATMRLIVNGELHLAGGRIGLRGDIAWPRPTRPGDVLHVESEIIEVRPSRSKPNQGIVKVRSATLTDNGEEVPVFTAKLLVFKRPPASS